MTDIRQNMVRAAARAIIVADIASKRVKWTFSKRLSEEEFRQATILSLEWQLKRTRGVDEGVAYKAVEEAAEKLADGISLDGVEPEGY